MDMKVQKAKLLERRKALVGDMQEIEDALDAPMPTDWEDRASERQGDEVLEALGQAELSELKRIDAALKRMEEGSYGTCQTCGKAVAEARLVAVPEAAQCISCA